MQIDWTLVSYVVIGIFALIGFFRGWWKEALTAFFLTLLVLLLRRPDLARTVVEWLNQGIAVVSRFLADLFGFPEGTETVFQLDPGLSSTWLIILFFVLGLSALLAWILLPGTTNKSPAKYYTPTFIGQVLGLLVGAVNGFLIINLVREYLDGRSLPGSASSEASATSIVDATIASPAPAFSIQVVNLPDFTILDSYIPWLIIGSGIFVLVALLWTRIKYRTKAGAGSKIEYVPPYGYKPFPIEPKKKPEPQEVKVVP